MSIEYSSILSFCALPVNVVWTFVTHLANAFLTNPDYRNGFLSAVMIGATMIALKRVSRTLDARIQAIKARRNEPDVVVEEPSMFTGVRKNVRRAMGLAVFVALLIIFF